MLKHLFDEDDLAADIQDEIKVNKGSLDTLVLQATDWTVGTIAHQISKGNIKLDPEFQRREAWSPKKKSLFIESLLLSLPIPQIVLAEEKNKKGQFIVIDGKQRLLTIMRFLGIGKFEPFKLTGLDILSELNRKSKNDIENNLLLSDYITTFENSTMRTVALRNWEDENILYQVFLRLNANTVSLSPQELRTALHPGPFLSFADKFTKQNNQLFRLLKIETPDFRMRDVELFIRFCSFAVRIEDYRGNLKVFLDDTCKILNKKWDDNEDRIVKLGEKFTNSLKITFEIFGDNAFRKWTGTKYETRYNKAIIDIMTYYFSDDYIAKLALTHKNAIIKAFTDLCTHNQDFIASLEKTTKSLTSTKDRFHLWGEALEQIIGTAVTLPTIRQK